MSSLRHATVEHVVRAAALAPELDNVLPPTLVWRDEVLEVWVRRSPDVEEDKGRCLVAGGTLQHIQVAARGLGLEATCEAFPEPSDPGGIARVRLAPGRPATPRELELAAAVVDQHAVRPGARVVPLAAEVLAVLRLAVTAEGAELVSSGEGVGDGLAVEAVVATRDDGPVAWVSAGCALGALLLRASQYGVQVSVERLPAPSRAGPDGHPHLVVHLVQLRLGAAQARREANPFATTARLAAVR